MSESTTTEYRIGEALAAYAESPSPPYDLQYLTGDASNRVYVRVSFRSLEACPVTMMAMVLPEDSARSEEAGGEASSERLPFIEVAEWLDDRGVPVPALFHYHQASRVLLLQDLGDRTLERALETHDRVDLYERAVDLLLDFQRLTLTPEQNLVVSQRAMDRDLLAWELDHYIEWRLEEDLGHGSGPWKDELRDAFIPLLDELCALPTCVAHRDFQSRNIMLPEQGGMVLIDFQDALIAPFIYDTVALLRDSYVSLGASEVEHLLARYSDGVRHLGVVSLTAAEIERAFHLQCVQRKLKDTGRFVFIDRVKGNPSFLSYRDPSMAYVRASLRALAGYERVRGLLAELDPEST